MRSERDEGMLSKYGGARSAIIVNPGQNVSTALLRSPKAMVYDAGLVILRVLLTVITDR